MNHSHAEHAKRPRGIQIDLSSRPYMRLLRRVSPGIKKRKICKAIRRDVLTGEEITRLCYSGCASFSPPLP